MLDPIFSPVQGMSMQSQPTPQPASKAAQVQAKTIPSRSKNEIATPSIRQALQKKTIDEPVAKEVAPVYAKSVVNDPPENKPFTEETLNNLWAQFAPRYKEEVHLFNTLKNKLIKISNELVQIQVDNSVQQEQLRLLKPEIIGFLRRGLGNQLIDLEIELLKSTYENKILTEDQKLQAMMNKNPNLFKLKGLFNLDFHG